MPHYLPVCTSSSNKMTLLKKDYLFVGLQVLLFLAYFIELKITTLGIPCKLTGIGYPLICLGFVLIIMSFFLLNKNLSPFPTPKENGVLIKHGIYKYIRHPIYTGLLCIVFGYAICTNSAYKCIVAFFIFILLYKKSFYEEKKLLSKFKTYALYKNKTGRFLPRIKQKT